MKCANCNRTVTKKTKFCPECGNKIVPKTSKSGPKEPKKITAVQAGLLIGVGIIVGIAILKIGESTPDSASSPPVSDFPSSLQSPAVLEIAAEFDCFCGSCEDRLDVCTCEHPRGALEVKGFILQKLQEGHHKPHIVEMVRENYGSGVSSIPPPPALN